MHTYLHATSTRQGCDTMKRRSHTEARVRVRTLLFGNCVGSRVTSTFGFWHRAAGVEKERERRTPLLAGERGLRGSWRQRGTDIAWPRRRRTSSGPIFSRQLAQFHARGAIASVAADACTHARVTRPHVLPATCAQRFSATLFPWSLAAAPVTIRRRGERG